jgi:uncharacterized protein (TIGR00730 family)
MTLSVAVFCASRPGHDPAHMETAWQTGALLAKNGYQVIYGGGPKGLMGQVARAALEHGGRVTGYTPEIFRASAEASPEGAEVNIVPTMDIRKNLLIQKSDAILNLSGGLGTIEEASQAIIGNYLHMAQNGEQTIRPVMIMTQSQTMKYLMKAYHASVVEGLSDPSVLQTLIDVQSPEEVIERMNFWRDNGFPKMNLHNPPEMKVRRPGVRQPM